MLKIAYYELKKLLRDTRWLVIFTLQPVILMILLGLVTFYEPKGISVGILNNSDNVKSEEFLNEIKKEESFSLKYFTDEESLRKDIESNKLKFATIVNIQNNDYISGSIELIENSTVPEITAKAKEKVAKIFEKKATEFAKENVQVNIDSIIDHKKSSFEEEKDNSLADLKNKIDGFSLPMPISDQFKEAINDVSIEADFSSGDNTDVPKVELIESKNTQKEPKYFDFYASAIIVILTILIALKLADTTITEERMTGTFERFFVTPYKKYHMILGKMIAFTVIDIFLAGIILLTMVALFEINLGPYWLVFLIAFVSALTAASLGIFISCITYTIAESIQVSNTIFFSFLILTGLLFQPESMHPAVKFISEILPFTFLVKAMREVNLLGMSFYDVWTKIAIAGLFIFIFLFSASVVLRRKAT
jgi:ABC-type multidrug transport system permease subunit